MTVLSDQAIFQKRSHGDVVIEPFRMDDVNTASYDVRLGPWFYRERPSEFTAEITNIYSPDTATRIWGEAQQAERAVDWMKHKPGLDWRNIDESDRVILIRPQENLLCHTLEFIGGRRDITTQMKARSTIGRLLLNVCQCAGQGDVGYYNRWTMEVYNRSPCRSLLLVVGRRVAQIVFDMTTPTKRDYGSEGHYQGSTDIKDMMESWNPGAMLPQAHTDKDIKRMVRNTGK